MINQSKTKRLVAMVTALLLGILCVLMDFPSITLQTVAAQANWSFDFGATAQSGFTSVSATQGYSASLGYGFRNTSGVKNVTAAGSGELSDAVQFTDTENTDNTFDVDVPNGLYSITVTLGNTTRTSVYMEGMLQIVNMTGNNATHTLQIPITDGQLNIRAAAGKAGYPFSISALKIQQISTNAVNPKTIWFCGDSTVCNYYPLDTSTQAGWGQVFSQYIDTNTWQVRDMAASGQYAKGFVDAGQFDAIEYYGKAGDVYIISIGINDTNYSNADEYYQTVTDMVQRAKAKGMKVILVKQQGRCSDVTNHPTLTGRWFGSTLDTIGTEQDVTVIDLFNLFFDYCKGIGQDATTALYMTDDDLHPNRQGAMKLAELAASVIDLNTDSTSTGSTTGTTTTTDTTSDEIPTDTPFLLQNKNSGLYLGVAQDTASNGANIQQNPKQIADKNLWIAKKTDDGYYYLYSALGDGNSFCLDVTANKATDGTNIELYQQNLKASQQYQFIANDDGSYVIATRVSASASCVEIINAYTDVGANVQEWTRNSHNCQSWIIEPVTLAETTTDTTIAGDFNHDGEVNALDAAYGKQQYIAGNGKTKSMYCAETNADGVVDEKDFDALQKHLLNNGTFACVTDSSAFYYAADNSFSQGVLESTNAGYRNAQYVNLDNKNGSFLEWNVTVPVAGNYLCTFSVANGSTANRNMKIEVNGATDYWMQDFLSTGSWTTWSEHGIVLPLQAGTNSICMTSATENGGPNIDYLHIELTEEPIAEVYVPETATDDTTTSTDTTTTTKTIYIAGDSTVQTYRASYAPQQGWGAYLQQYMPEGYTVSNQAIAGRSSKSFYDNGRLDTILNTIQSGDLLLVQFGINDSASSNAERYAPVCGTIPGTEGSFEYYIAKYIEGAKEKGATPVLVTTTLGLKAYNSSTGLFTGSYSNYCDAMKRLASYYQIPCVDLNSLMVDHYNSIGYDVAYTYHLISTELSTTDMTHFTETGADAVAQLVANEMKRQNIVS